MLRLWSGASVSQQWYLYIPSTFIIQQSITTRGPAEKWALRAVINRSTPPHTTVPQYIVSVCRGNNWEIIRDHTTTRHAALYVEQEEGEVVVDPGHRRTGDTHNCRLLETSRVDNFKQCPTFALINWIKFLSFHNWTANRLLVRFLLQSTVGVQLCLTITNNPLLDFAGEPHGII